MCRVLESVQPKLQSDNTYAQTLRIQAISVRPLRQGIPAQSRFETAPRMSTQRVNGINQQPTQQLSKFNRNGGDQQLLMRTQPAVNLCQLITSRRRRGDEGERGHLSTRF